MPEHGQRDGRSPTTLNRRAFVARVGTTGAMLVCANSLEAEADAPPRVGIDANVSLFQWPFRRLPLDETDRLRAKMAQLGVESAWAGSFEGVLHRDVASVNARLAEACARFGGRLVPFGTVNVSLPDWEEDLRRCHEVHRMPGIRLFPNYHRYTFADPPARRLLQLAAQRKLVVQIAVTMEDVRTQHPLASVPDVDVRPLAEALTGATRARVMLLNAGRAVPAATAKSLAALGVYFDTSRVEGVAGVGAFVRSLPRGRVVFGTHAPFLNYETGVLKVYESGLTAQEAAALLGENARTFLHAG